MEAGPVQRRIEALERAAEDGCSTRASPAAGPAIDVPVQAVLLPGVVSGILRCVHVCAEAEILYIPDA